jgi:hypothetical protein
MTGYYIEVGYNSCYHEKEVWQELKEVVINICKNPEIIKDEIKREIDIEIPDRYIEAYKWPCKDLTIKIVEKNIGTDEEKNIYNNMRQVEILITLLIDLIMQDQLKKYVGELLID